MKKILFTGLLGTILGFYSLVAYRTLHSLQIFFVSATMGKIYAYTYLVTSLLSIALMVSFVTSVVKLVKKRKEPKTETHTAAEQQAPLTPAVQEASQPEKTVLVAEAELQTDDEQPDDVVRPVAEADEQQDNMTEIDFE